MTRLARRSEFGALIGGLAIVAGAVATLRAFPQLSTTTVGLVLLLIVLGIATLGRLWVAVSVAVFATGAYNFFFFQPIGTFRIADPQNWVAVVAFLVTAIIGSKLSTAAQARAQEAIDRRNEVTRLFDLTRDVLLTSESAGAIDALARHVARRFELERVAVCLPTEGGWQLHQGGAENIHVDTELLNTSLANARGSLEFDAHQRADGGSVRASDSRRDIVVLPLRHGTKAIGLLATAAPDLDIGALDAVAGVVAIAIERTQLLGEREAAELVRQKAELASTLLASLSHDLKTPLTAIRVAVENLAGDLANDDRQAQASAAVTELERLNRLFQDILDMARIDASAMQVERQWVTAADVVDAATAQVRHSLDGRPVRVDADAETVVDIDPRVASVALSHLLENAAHYSPQDGEVVVEAAAQADGLHISVTDSGPGLDPAELDHLFERFFRGQRAKQLAPGTGMGLAITRGLLSAVGGHVWAENVHGAGARFTMSIPGRTRPVSVAE